MEGSVEAWRVHDTGLVVAPSRWRRLPGVVRHHQGEGDAWPAQVALALEDGALVVRVGSDAEEVGRWPVAEVSAQRIAAGPPVSFVIGVPGSSQLLAAAPGPDLDELLAALGA